MYAVYKQAHPPTGLEFTMYCNFFNNSERNLVVAGTSQLYVYRLNRDAEVGRVEAVPQSFGRFPSAGAEVCQGSLGPRASSSLPRCLASSYPARTPLPAVYCLFFGDRFSGDCCTPSTSLAAKTSQ